MATPRRLRHHAGIFGSGPAYTHEAMVAAYAIPGSRLKTIPPCSHLAQEDAAAVVEPCKDFSGP